jgi:hypothetical protein
VIYFSDAPGGADTYSMKFTLTGVRLRESSDKPSTKPKAGDGHSADK